MDVRCEKCLTVYELDDARVDAARAIGGLTVKCQECGNLFKVRRRPDTAELVVPGAKQPELVSDPNLDAQPTTVTRTEETTAASSRARRVLGVDDAVPEPIESAVDTEPSDAPKEIGWMVRSAKTHDVQRFRELTTLQQWIVERKVSREDEISRGGESWKSLGGIAELASFFHVVEQAESVARATQPGLAVRRANQEGSLDRDQLAQLPTDVRRPALPPTFADGGEDSATTLQAPSQRRGNTGMWIGLAFVIGGAAAGSWLYMQRQEASKARGAEEARVAIEKGRSARLLDTDDGFRQAIAMLDPVAATTSEAKVELAESHVTWATYLAEEAKALEPTNATASHTLASESQDHLERAQRALDGTNAEDPRVALARADLWRAQGQPVEAVERELAKARTAPADALLYQVEGELALRDGKLDEARAKLTQAGNAHAQRRLAQLDAKKAPVDLGTAPSTPDLAVATVAKTEPDKPDTKTDVPAGDYASLVKEGNRLAENGRSKDAQKRYERALELDGKGVQALVGLGYCDLEAERFMQAVDRFNAALAIDSNAGDALVGLAESYRIRGRNAQAAELYKKYLTVHPTGDRAGLAKKALQQLEHTDPKGEKIEPGKSESTPILDHVTVKNQEEKPAEKTDKPAEKTEKPTEKDEETPLPRLPEP